MSLCAEIAPLNPGDRVCQWYSGLAMLTDTLTEREGLTDPHNALARRTALQPRPPVPSLADS